MKLLLELNQYISEADMLAVCQSTDIVIYDFPKIIFLKK